MRLPAVMCMCALALLPANAAPDRAPSKRFYVAATGRDAQTRDVVAYVEDLVQHCDVAQLARSREECDYILEPSVRIQSRVTQDDHKRTVETEETDSRGEKTKKREERTVHSDDVATVSVSFSCAILKASDSRDSRPLLVIDGQVSRSTKGHNTPGHNATDSPIRIHNYQLSRLEAELGTPNGNTGQPHLYRAIYDLCALTARVSAVDRDAKRITVEAGSDHGLQGKGDRDGASEVEVYAQTGNQKAYFFEDPSTGRLYYPDKKSAEARPGSPRDWTYKPDEPLPGEKGVQLRGADVDSLKPLGERVVDWAEVQELFRTTCAVTPKRRGDFGRTTDDTKTLKALPDPAAVPMVARLRAKHWMGRVTP